MPAPDDTSLLWPLHGVARFFSRPRLWGRPVIGTLLAWLALGALALAVVAFTWPTTPPEGIWWTLVAYLSPFIWGLVTFACSWMLLLPVLMVLIYEDLAKHILREQGREIREQDLLRGGLAGAIFALRTLPWRLGWLTAGILFSFLLPPVGFVISLIGLGHLALIDACDICFGLLGVDGKIRYRLIREHAKELLSTGAVAGVGGHLLALTVVGWWFWMPGLVVGAAQRCPDWIDQTETPTA
jgi:hypothetical protein